METSSQQERGIGRLASDLAADTATLVRREIELAKAEVAQNAAALGSGIALFAVAAFIALAALAVLVAAAVLGLAEWLQPWLAALAGAGGMLVIAGILALVGRARTRRGASLAPTETITKAKQDVAWLRQRRRS